MIMVAGIAIPSYAMSFEVAVWRGETFVALMPDFVEIENASEGIAVRYGVLQPVRYAPVPGSLQRVYGMDRVEWGITSGGPRVVEISVAPEMKPGVYECGMMRIRVINRVLPPAKEWRYHLDLWQHPWAVARYFGVRPFSKEHYAAMRPVYETLATAGQKTLTTTILPEPWAHQCRDRYDTMVVRIKKADGSWSFDYSIFDEYVEFGRSCGLGPDIACYSICPWGCVLRWNDESGKEHSLVAPPDSPFFEEYWGAFLVDFAAHLKRKGWFSDVYLAMDERSVEEVKATVELIRKFAPGIKVSMAGNIVPSAYGTAIDNYSVLLGEGIDAEFIAEAKKRRMQGMKTTFYVCCGPRQPNTFLCSGLGEAFWLGAYPSMCGLDGFLRWAWNSWPEDPVIDASYCSWMAGDTFLVYPDGSPSWRFMDMRNGIVAAEKIRMLKEQGVFVDEINVLAGKYNSAEASSGKSDYVGIRTETLNLVNRD